MKLKSLLAAAMAVIALASCTKEIIKEVPVGDGTQTGDTYVKFTLDANMVKTRALPDDHDELEPTVAENKIYNYALFVFKSNGMLEATLVGKSKKLEEPLSPTVNSDGDKVLTFTKDENPDLEWNETEDAIRISAGAKTFFAIVNAPREFVAEQGSFINNKQLTLTELKDITLTLGGNLNKIVGEYSNGNVSLTNPVNSGDPNRGFMMTNIIADGQSDAFRRMTLEEKEEDDPINVTVTVGRAMAKVSLASDLKSYSEIITADKVDQNQKYGVLDTKEYKIINNPNEMNVALNVLSGVIMTPYISHTSVSVNSYFFSNNSSHAKNTPEESFYIPVSKGPNDKTFNYCIENANNKPKYGNATIALIKGNYTPLSGTVGSADIRDADFNEQTLAPGNDFYRIWIKPYTDSNGDPQGGVYAEEYFTQSIANKLNDFRTYKGWPTNPTDDDYAELEEVYYKEGLCYYYLPLYNKDKENSGDPYTVVRNSYYRIDIKSVDGPGYPENPEKPGEPGGPDKPGPEVPLEEQTYINAEIKVANWDEVNQTGNL